MRRFPIRDNFPSGFYEALGRFAVAFGRVEYEIKLAVKSFVRAGTTKTFSEGMSEAESSGQFRKLCIKAKIFAKTKLPEPHLTIFCDLIDTAISVAPERNDNLHAMWTTHDAGLHFACDPIGTLKPKT